jgi:hypothetical protein
VKEAAGMVASAPRSLRRDVKFMANSLLSRIPEMRELLIPMNPFKQNPAVDVSKGDDNAYA